MKKWNWKDKTVSHHSFFLLCICFAVILFELLLIVLPLVPEHPEKLYEIRLFRGMLEYIMLDITITVVGAFLLDITAREYNQS